MASLENVRAKIEWSRKHLNLFKSEVFRYLNEESTNATVKVQADTNLIKRVNVDPTPILVVHCLILGDCLQNLRSSLDYLVGELVLAANNVPDENHQFPICESLERFKSQCGRKRLDGIPVEAQALIESLQPYHCPQGWNFSSLWILNELCNINKHRHVLVVKSNPIGILTETLDSFGEAINSFVTVGDQAADIRIARVLGPGEKVEVKEHSVSHIVFDEEPARGCDVFQTIREIGFKISEGIIPRFERFFS
jgi:hypothetical protein